MKKTEIIAMLQELKDIMDLSPDEFIVNFNNTHQNGTQLKRYDYYPFMLGYVEATLKTILNEK